MASSQERQPLPEIRDELEQSLRDKWEERKRNLEAIENGDSDEGSDLARHSPEIDSKEVASMRPVFEGHLDVDFEPKYVRPGGYDSIDDLIDDIVPPMIEKARSSRE